jgi:hypothetical protein
VGSWEVETGEGDVYCLETAAERGGVVGLWSLDVLGGDEATP